MKPLSTLTLFSDRIRANYDYLFKLTPLSIIPVLKSDGYGMGAVHLAKILDPFSPPLFAVHSLQEATELYEAGIKTPILIMGYVSPSDIKNQIHPFHYGVYTKEEYDTLLQYQPQAKLHLFVETGMHREGISLRDLESFPLEQVAGLMSHVAAPDEATNPLTIAQLQAFEKAQKIVLSRGATIEYVHMLASRSLYKYTDYTSYAVGTMARVGIGLHGIDKFQIHNKLAPIARFSTFLVQAKELKKGESVGYDFTYTAEKDMYIGILPIGYRDGIDRRLSGKGCVTINGIECPIVGRVSMNMTTIALPALFPLESEVIVFSEDINAPNSWLATAKKSDMIIHNLLTGLRPHETIVI